MVEQRNHISVIFSNFLICRVHLKKINDGLRVCRYCNVLVKPMQLTASAMWVLSTTAMGHFMKNCSSQEWTPSTSLASHANLNTERKLIMEIWGERFRLSQSHLHLHTFGPFGDALSNLVIVIGLLIGNTVSVPDRLQFPGSDLWRHRRPIDLSCKCVSDFHGGQPMNLFLFPDFRSLR